MTRITIPAIVIMATMACGFGMIVRRNAVTDPARLWPNGNVPYTFHPGIDAYHKVHLLAAMKQLTLSVYSNHKACVYFVPRSTEADYAEFQFTAVNENGGSVIGRAGGKQTVTIHPEITQDSILMSLMFLLGINPEVARTDRDNVLTIVQSNINASFVHDFTIETNTDTFKQQFDYNSVVMYPPYFGAINRSMPTIMTKQDGFTIGQVVALSIADVNLVQHIYHCPLDASHRIDLLGPLVFECHFHTDVCNLNQDEEDDFDWSYQTGPSPTAGTGPNADHSSGSGGYALASAIGHHSQIARLKTPSYSAGTYCFVFWLYVYGPDVGTVRIIQTDNVGDKAVIGVNVQPISQWYHTSTTIVAKSQFYLSIEAFMGNGDQGDIAVDDVYIYNGQCIDWY